MAGNKTVELLSRELGLSNLCARILFSRGFSDPRKAKLFLHPKIEDLSDPFLLPDMEKAVLRVIEAIRTNEKVCIYGDYDADGVTSAALMINFLKPLGITPVVYLPERREGYGLNGAAIRKLKKEGITLLICLDCGATNVGEIKEANALGIETVVIDHHETGDELPPAYAIINPKRKDAQFPTRELAACGVVFFFLLAFRRVLFRNGQLPRTINLKQELDLVALGTVADMVPLTGDNRIIVKFGMEMMKKKPRTWLRSFYASRILARGAVDEYSLGFIIIPRINASGRVSSPDHALRFLVSEDESASRAMLSELHDVNRRRQKIEQEIVREAVEAIEMENLADRNSIVLFREGWHIGVIGIVAQKLTEMYQKPSIVITEVDGLWKGSGRGGDGIDLHNIIESVSHLVEKFGGHKYACGISLLEENLIPFRDAFDERVEGTLQTREKIIRADTSAAFEELTGDLVDFIEMAAPFGMGNPRPNLLLKPYAVRMNNRFAKIIDEANHMWHGTFRGRISMPDDERANIIASPVIKEDMGERFIHLAIKEFVTPEGVNLPS
ncbi:MAG: single-stranded-DNA-specific exonuclease RecJ [Syntrophobacterales bacterium]|jgi:single-stranded-DNA-specific exonuclease|nr:single-stranded-DNA-specific exonuclease RecJ [Syntrophobacterales bacterium]